MAHRVLGETGLILIPLAAYMSALSGPLWPALVAPADSCPDFTRFFPVCAGVELSQRAWWNW